MYILRIALFKLLLLFPLILSSQADTLEYLFAGHTYYWKLGEVQKVDYRLEALNLDKYDQVWLGGDICTESSLKNETIQYIDSLFDISNEKNHWTLGNHDIRNGNWEWIRDATKRNDYYTHYQDGITVIVLNTNLNASDCENLNKQYKMITQVCDTIKESSHLIILSHHNIWNNIPGLEVETLDSHGLLSYYNMNCHSINSTFSESIYPILIEVQKKGVQVLNIMGDAGWGNPTAVQSDDCIWFMASGINGTFYLPDHHALLNSYDQVLVIKHIPKLKKLWWEYQFLDILYKKVKQARP